MVYYVTKALKTISVESVFCRQNNLQRIPPYVVKSQNG